MLLRIILSLIVMCISIPAYAEEMTVEQAYQAIPHQRTPFDPQQSNTPPSDAKYLNDLFFVTDMALRLRVMTLDALMLDESTKVTSYNAEIDDLINTLALVKTPQTLENVQAKIVSAIREQQQFFNDWAIAKGTRQYDKNKNHFRENPLVISSHIKLTEAFGELKALYPGESQHNQQAFYDHLCALDFL